MAKKIEKVLVDCSQCQSGGTEVINLLLDCNNKERNPKGFKVGTWPKECSYFKQRK